METVHSDEAKRALLLSSSLLMRVLYDTYTRAFASLSTMRFTCVCGTLTQSTRRSDGHRPRTRSVLNSRLFASETTSSPSGLVSTLPTFRGAPRREHARPLCLRGHRRCVDGVEMIQLLAPRRATGR